MQDDVVATLGVIAAYLNAEFGAVSEPRDGTPAAFTLVVEDADQILEVEQELAMAGISAARLRELDVARTLRQITPSLEYVSLSTRGLEVLPIARS